MNELTKIDKNIYSHFIITDVLIVYLKTLKPNGKNYFYICDKYFGLQESDDKKCYIVKLAQKGKCDNNA